MIRIVVRIVAAAVALWVAQWWLRGWAQYRADEIVMDAAMAARNLAGDE
jgi:hypothetical protein